MRGRYHRPSRRRRVRGDRGEPPTPTTPTASPSASRTPSGSRSRSKATWPMWRQYRHRDDRRAWRGAGQLLRDADIALYEAKGHNGSSVVLYTGAMIRRMQHSVDMERRLRHAMYTDQLWVATSRSSRCRTAGSSVSKPSPAGTPTTARWPRRVHRGGRRRGAARGTGQATDPRNARFQKRLPTGWTCSSTCRRARSPPTGDRRWFDEALLEAGADPRQVFIEVTETDAINDHAITGRMQQLRERSMRIALDDFGVGHSSLSALRALPLDLAKVDRSFLVSSRDDTRAERSRGWSSISAGCSMSG